MFLSAQNLTKSLKKGKMKNLYIPPLPKLMPKLAREKAKSKFYLHDSGHDYF